MRKLSGGGPEFSAGLCCVSSGEVCSFFCVQIYIIKLRFSGSLNWDGSIASCNCVVGGYIRGLGMTKLRLEQNLWKLDLGSRSLRVFFFCWSSNSFLSEKGFSLERYTNHIYMKHLWKV